MPDGENLQDASRDAPAARATLALIGIVGAGVMGRGIAQLALENGHEVVLHDVDDSALDHAPDRIHQVLHLRSETRFSGAGEARAEGRIR